MATIRLPGPVPPEIRRRRTFLSDARCRAPLASRTRRLGRAARHPVLRRRRLPICSCTGWGLPCRPGYPGRGALLPHRFTLATRASRRRSAVCSLWHCPAGHPGRSLTGTLPCGARTFLGGHEFRRVRPDGSCSAAASPRRRTFLSDARCRAPLASRTRRLGRAARHPALRRGRLPICSCTGWGLPCHPCHQGCGALLPHRFTLATHARRRRSAVCSLWHFPADHPGRSLTGTLPCGARTFLDGPEVRRVRPGGFCPAADLAVLRGGGHSSGTRVAARLERAVPGG